MKKIFLGGRRLTSYQFLEIDHMHQYPSLNFDRALWKISIQVNMQAVARSHQYQASEPVETLALFLHLEMQVFTYYIAI